MTTVSVVMATYQGSLFLSEQLASLAAQTRMPDELVVGDDGSTDGTLEILRAFARSAPFPVHVHRNTGRLGVAGNFSQGISLASGDTIALSDQDDVWLPDKLERQLRALDAQPTAVGVFGDATLVDGSLRPLGATLFDSVGFTAARRRRMEACGALATLLAWPVVCGATLAFRSSYRGLLLPIPPSGFHDVWISVLLSTQGELLALPEPLIEYRQHGSNQVGAGRLSRGQKLAQRRGRGTLSDEVSQFRALAGRLEGALPAGADGSALDLVREKVAHLELRYGLVPQRRLGVFSALVRGRYHRYSRGLESAAYDLFFRGRKG